jgi:UDP-2,3-diacylglucosamine pyrophosphatase LpxH
MDRDIIIIGDLHLVDCEARQKGSRRYKDPRFSIDRPFSDFLIWIRYNAKGPVTLIINGDFIDFDLIFLGSAVDVATAKRKFNRVLRDHRLLFEAILRLLEDEKNRLIFILGNHDLEFTQNEFLKYFFLSLSRLSNESGCRGLDQNALKGRITIEPWFYHETDLLYTEHGDRFDRYSCSPRVISPTINGRSGPPFLSLGSLSNRYILKDLPTFNPFMSEQVIRRLRGYLGHLFRYYLIPPYRLPYLYLKGAIRTFAAAVRQREEYHSGPGHEMAKDISDIGSEKSLKAEEILRLWRLGKKPIILTSPLRAFHVLWLDRISIFFLFGIMYLPVTLAIQSLWVSFASIPLMVLLYFLYQLPWGKKEVLKERRSLREHARKIGHILHTPYVILSHSHIPEEVPCGGGSRYLNCGSWATIFEDEEGSRPWKKARTYVHLRIRGGNAKALLMRWTREGPVRMEVPAYLRDDV